MTATLEIVSALLVGALVPLTVAYITTRVREWRRATDATFRLDADARAEAVVRLLHGAFPQGRVPLEAVIIVHKDEPLALRIRDRSPPLIVFPAPDSQEFVRWEVATFGAENVHAYVLTGIPGGGAPLPPETILPRDTAAGV